MFKDKKRKQWLITALVITIVFVVRLIIIYGLNIYPFSKGICDDLLLEKWGVNIAQLNWKGDFDCFTFAKLPGFSIYLAVLNILKLPYLFTTNVLYLIGAIVLVYALSNVIKSKTWLCIIYAVLAFNPIMTSYLTTQRVYRNGFGVVLTVWVIGSLLCYYFSACKKKFVESFIWMIFLFFSIGFMWITKEDSVWMLPFLIGVLVASFINLLARRKDMKIWYRLILLVVPFVGMVSFKMLVKVLDTNMYGASSLEYFDLVVEDMKSVESPDKTEIISVPYSTLEKLCEVSPTLDSIKGELLHEIEAYGWYDTDPDDGELDDGWYGWAVMSAVENAGHYVDAKETNAFYKKIYGEIEAGFDGGKIEREKTSVLSRYHLNSFGEIKKLASTTKDAWVYIISHKELNAKAFVAKKKNISNDYRFAEFTHEHITYPYNKGDYVVNGWLYMYDYEVNDLDFYFEDASGKQYKKIKFGKSDDLVDAYEEIDNIDNNRFVTKWNVPLDEFVDEYFLVGYDKDEIVYKCLVDTKKTKPEICKGNYLGNIDAIIVMDSKVGRQSNAVNRCNFICRIYKVVFRIVDVIALVGALVYTIYVIVMFKRKNFEELNSWLVIIGVLLSILVLTIGIAVTTLNDCPGITCYYLSAAYPLLDMISVVVIYKIVCIICKCVKCHNSNLGEVNPDEENSDGEKSAEEKSDGEKSDGENSAEEKSAGDNSDGEKSDGENQNEEAVDNE